MFRRLSNSLPPDPTFPHDFKQLGYKITPDGFVKKIDFPDEDFQFFITNNERYNDVHREAMHACIRDEVIERLSALDITPLYLPQLTSEKSSGDIQSLPILCTAPQLLSRKRRLIVVMNRQFEDLAILSYRLLSKTGGIDQGSAVAFVKEIRRRSNKNSCSNEEENMPGVLIMNAGQLLYSYRHAVVMTPTSWNAMPRASAVHPIPTVHPQLNHVPGNRTVEEHLVFVFEKILCEEKFVAKGTEIYLVGLADGGDEMVKYLEKNWRTLHPHLNILALALAAALPITTSTAHIPLTNLDFLHFMATRAKVWAISSESPGTLLSDATALRRPIPDTNAAKECNKYLSTTTCGGSYKPIEKEDEKEKEKEENNVPRDIVAPDNEPNSERGEEEEAYIHLCPTISGGEELHAECVFPRVYGEILDWFEGMAVADPAVVVDGGNRVASGGRKW